MESLIPGLLEASVPVITQLNPADKSQFIEKKNPSKADELQALVFFRKHRILYTKMRTKPPGHQSPKTAKNEQQELQKAA